jgi:hypothetical protein
VELHDILPNEEVLPISAPDTLAEAEPQLLGLLRVASETPVLSCVDCTLARMISILHLCRAKHLEVEKWKEFRIQSGEKVSEESWIM